MNAAKTRSSLFIRKLTYSALCLALAIVLPFLTGQIPQIGSMLCPMHIPALLCGFLCGWQYGAVVGFVSPLLRMLMFGMPPVYVAIAMAFELAALSPDFSTVHSRRTWLAFTSRSLPL